MLNLLSKLGLENHMLSDTEPVEPAQRDIHWAVVHDRLDAFRRESIDFLKTALS